MGLFDKTKKIAGRMVVHFQEDGICAAFMKRSPGGKPAVERIAFYSAGTPPAALPLEKVAKDLHGTHYSFTNLLTAGEPRCCRAMPPIGPQMKLKRRFAGR